MHRLILTVTSVGLGVLAASGPATAMGGGEAAAVEHARMNALAGGPVSAYDADLLESRASAKWCLGARLTPRNRCSSLSVGLPRLGLSMTHRRS